MRQPGPNNDLIDLTSQQPKLADLTSTVLPRAIQTLDRAQPVFEYARSYTPDFAAWLTNFGQLPANYDANGHYARVQPMFLPTTFSRRDRSPRSTRPEAQRLRHGNLTRCPGGIIQPAPDGSNPAPAGTPATRPRPRPAHEAARLDSPRRGHRPVARDRRGGRHGREDRGDAYFVRAIFDNASSLVEGEDVKIAGAAIGVVDTSR